MNASYAVLVCFSAKLMKRERTEVYAELNRAITLHQSLPPGRAFIVPVRLTPCEIPAIPIGPRDTLEALNAFDWFDLTARDAALNKLVKTLDKARQPR